MPELIRGFLSRYALVGVWLAMAALFAAIRPQVFLTPAILDTIFGTQSVLVVLSLALLITLIAGDFDLSAASVLGMSATLIVTLNTNGGLSIGVCVALALVAGMVTGVVNGILVVYVGVDAIVATLGMGTLLLGLAELISGGVTIGNIDQSLVRAATDTLLGLPHLFYAGLFIAVIFWYVLGYTPLGRHLSLVGGAREMARLVGIPVQPVRFGAYVASGFVSALAGVLLAGQLGAFESVQAPSYLLPAFAAAFLGSTAVAPGQFNAWGTVIAIYFLITGITGLSVIGLSGWINDGFYGASLVVAVTLSTLARKRTAAQ